LGGPSNSDGRRFRPEIEGLRAVAALLVATYHIFLGRVSGGVDVFFVVSGFLITTSLVRPVEAGGRPEFVRFVSRLMARLLPLAVLVLLAVTAATLLWLPLTRQASTLGEIVASALYVENWALALKAVDYAAQGEAKSPVQHFWALSVQGQFYLAWFAIVAATLLVAGRRRFRAALAVVFGAAFAASLVFSIALTATNQPLAYFHTGARMWEFAAGGLLALGAPRIDEVAARRPILGRVGAAAGWLGLALVVSCGLVFNVSTLFPGWVALWPVAGALLIVGAGGTGGRWGVDRVLGSRPFVAAGTIAYALYLVHWPILVFVQSARERTGPAGLRFGLLVLAASLVLAYVGTRLVATPVRARLTGLSWTPRRVAGIGLASMVLVAVTASRLVAAPPATAGALPLDPSLYPGAGGMGPGGPSGGPPVVAPSPPSDPVGSGGPGGPAPSPPASSAPAPGTEAPATPQPPLAGVPLQPDLRTIDRDRGHFHADGCLQGLTDTSLVTCTGGRRDGPVTAMVVGGSHSLHWLPAIEPVAEARGWRLVTALKADCPMSAGPFADDERGRSCDAWNRALIDAILAQPPDLVITTSTTTTPRGEETRAGYVERWRQLEAAGVAVAAIRDTPRASSDRPECLARHGTEPWVCAIPRSPTLDAVDPARLVPGLPENVTLLDFTDALCTQEACPAVIGNVVVYRDAHHLSATFATTMAAIVDARLPDPRTLGSGGG
jgi:peptidoglycan/LPS O-acetylase OafA/YrhL